MRDGHQAHTGRAPIVRVLVAFAALGFAALGTPAASADLGPPSAAPPVTKRKCARYTVVKSQAGPQARCTAYGADTLRTLNQRQGPQAQARGPLAAASGPGAANHGAKAPSASAPRAGSNGGGPTSGQTSQPTGGHGAIGAQPSASSKSPSSSAMSLSLLAAIVAASTLGAGALLALMRGPIIRWRNGDARGTAP